MGSLFGALKTILDWADWVNSNYYFLGGNWLGLGGLPGLEVIGLDPLVILLPLELGALNFWTRKVLRPEQE